MNQLYFSINWSGTILSQATGARRRANNLIIIKGMKVWELLGHETNSIIFEIQWMAVESLIFVGLQLSHYDAPSSSLVTGVPWFIYSVTAITQNTEISFSNDT